MTDVIALAGEPHLHHFLFLGPPNGEDHPDAGFRRGAWAPLFVSSGWDSLF